MKFIRYSRYRGELADGVSLEDLVNRLGDFLLQSGFESQYYGFDRLDPEQTLEQLRQAILRALMEGDLLPPDLAEKLLNNSDPASNIELKDLLDELIERLAQEGYISTQPPLVTPPPEKTPVGGADADSLGHALVPAQGLADATAIAGAVVERPHLADANESAWTNSSAKVRHSSLA